MILTDFTNLKRYKKYVPYLTELIAFLSEYDFSEISTGTITLIEDEIFVNIVKIDIDENKTKIMEAHRDFLDIHIPLNQEEIIGWKVTAKCSQTVEEYSKENDCVLFSDAPSTYFTVQPGELAIVFPEDAHIPAIGKGLLKKAIVKIRVASNF